MSRYRAAKDAAFSLAITVGFYMVDLSDGLRAWTHTLFRRTGAR